MSLIKAAPFTPRDEHQKSAQAHSFGSLSEAELRRAQSSGNSASRADAFAALTMPHTDKVSPADTALRLPRAEEVINRAASLNFRVSLVSENVESQVFKIDHIHDKALGSSIIIPATLSDNERKRLLAENLRQILPPA